MPPKDWVDTNELPPDTVLAVEVSGRQLALVNREGKFYALDGVCPHLGGPLGEGALWKGELECPWHHFRYDLETGRNTYPANVYPDDLPQLQADLKPLKTYAVKVERGRILVSLGATNDC